MSNHYFILFRSSLIPLSTGYKIFRTINKQAHILLRLKVPSTRSIRSSERRAGKMFGALYHMGQFRVAKLNLCWLLLNICRVAILFQPKHIGNGFGKLSKFY